MLKTVRAVVRAGKIELLEPVDLPAGTTVLVTPLIEEDTLPPPASAPTSLPLPAAPDARCWSTGDTMAINADKPLVVRPDAVLAWESSPNWPR